MERRGKGAHKKKRGFAASLGGEKEKCLVKRERDNKTEGEDPMEKKPAAKSRKKSKHTLSRGTRGRVSAPREKSYGLKPGSDGPTMKQQRES